MDLEWIIIYWNSSNMDINKEKLKNRLNLKF